ncbi:MAG: hypothetical protein V3U03_16685 [Myxococcota bacterium]
MFRTTAAPLAVALTSLALLSAPARAESSLVLPYPSVFGTIPASTYDAERHRVGAAHLVLEKRDNGHVRIFSESGIDGGPRTVATAELAPIEAGEGLRLLSQESRSFDAEGTPMGILRIDHTTATASCANPNGDIEAQIDLPERDRVANVPLNLLFLPLVSGDVDRVTFQVMTCRGGARLLDFEAHRARRGDRNAERLVEVRYGPSLGRVLSALAGTLLPKLSFWFDPNARNAWVAHRVPLYTMGPEVLVVRDGVPANWLSGGR